MPGTPFASTSNLTELSRGIEFAFGSALFTEGTPPVLNDIVEKFQNKLKELKGENLYVNNWGKKKLAYPINKERYGMYILFQFQSDGISNKEFNLGLDHNANILTYLTTKIDKDTILGKGSYGCVYSGLNN